MEDHGGALKKRAHQYVSGRLNTRAIVALTAQNERRTLKMFTDAMGNRRPENIGRSDIERWLGSMSHLAPGTVRGRFAIANRFLNHLVDVGDIRRNPARAIPAPKVPRSRHRNLSAEQTAALFAACSDAREACIVTLVFQLGLRRAEVAAIDVGDITWGRRPWLLVHGKGGHERPVPLVKDAARAINHYLSQSPAYGGPLIRGDRYPMRGVSPDWIGRRFNQVAYAAGVKVRTGDGISTHAGRHTCATDVYEESGGDVMAVKDLLGHVSLQTTQVYVNGMNVEKLRSAMEGRSYRGAEVVPLKQPGRSRSVGRRQDAA